ncbi:MAG: hypothetical protein IJG33_13915 [Selenomonadaceae bacterium]|nr:hypothetical protein [Selenomonadaceae bacterium]
MTDEKKKFQIQRRIRKITSPNDKLVKTVFNLPASEYAYVIESGERDWVTEKKIRGVDVKTYFWLKVIGVPEGKKIPTHFEVDGIGTVNISRPLNEFDRAIFDACISTQEAGLKIATVDFLFRIMTGDDKKQPTRTEKTAILESIGKMMTTLITIDFSEAREKMKKYDSAPARLVGAILPCQYLDGVKVNGQETAIIKFLDESPLLEIARAKKQIINYPSALLEIFNQNNTPLVTRIKSYVIRRVHEIILHPKDLRPTITFEDVFKHCDLANATKWQKQDARKIIFEVTENLKAQGVIRSFEKKKDGKVYHAISFIF